MNKIGMLILLFLVTNIEIVYGQDNSSPVDSLHTLYKENKEFRHTIDQMLRHADNLGDGSINPWKGKSVEDLYDFMNEWFYFLPHSNDGLDRIITFSYLSYDNTYGAKFILEEPGLGWTHYFVQERGKYMDSPESTLIIEDWLNDTSLTNNDFILPRDGFKSFNEFFIRDLKPGKRPIHSLDDESVIVSPADGIINMIANELELNTKLPTKGRMTMSLNNLLDKSKYAKQFIGGSALAVFLMPDNYHHYHSPVSGQIIESKEKIGEKYFGSHDLIKLLNKGNPGYNSDYSIFENYKHGYFIIQTQDHGLVAMIPIGLETVGSVVFEDKFKNIVDNPKKVYKGEKLGHFAYGGSTVLLIFEKGGLNSLTVEQGQRIGKLKN